MAYKYNKTTWIDIEQDPEHATPLCSANFNNIENGLESVDLRTSKLEEDIKNIDVTDQINEHNTSKTSHQDIRNAIANIDVSTQINEHDSSQKAHSSILGNTTLNTQDKTVKGAINETLNQIGVLSEDRGYLNISETESNPDNLIYNGKYSIFNPAGLPYPQCRYNFDITARGTYLIQLATIVYQAPAAGSANLLGLTFKRVKDADGFKEWNKNPTSDEITDLQTGKADKNPTGYSPSIVSIGGLGTINTRDNSTDTPPISDGWGTFLSSGGSRDFQIGYKWNDSMARLWYRVHKGDAEYRDWKQVATTDKIDISLLNGWSNRLGNPQVTKVGSICMFSCQLTSGVCTNNTILFTVGSDFAPKYQQTQNLIQRNGQKYTVSMETNGEVKLADVGLGLPITNIGCDFNISWRID